MSGVRSRGEIKYDDRLKGKLMGLRMGMSVFFVIVTALFPRNVSAQESDSTLLTQEQQINQYIEFAAAAYDDPELDYTSLRIYLEYYFGHPLDLNTPQATDQLRQLYLLSGDQIKAFEAYKAEVGRFISIYELQSIEGWGLDIIARIRPFVYVRNDLDAPRHSLDQLLGNSRQTLLQSVRYKSDFDRKKYPAGAGFATSMRYHYNSGKQLEAGFTLENDAGEGFNKRIPADFYSGFIRLRTIRKLDIIAGDYNISLGQGVLCRTAFAPQRVLDAGLLARGGEQLSGYRSANENRYFRGVALQYRLSNNISLLGFASRKEIDSRIIQADSVSGAYVSGLLSSGYHRTDQERSTRHSLGESIFGTSLSWRGYQGELAFNTFYAHYDLPLYNPAAHVYQRYKNDSNALSGASVSGKYHFRNVVFFGEGALGRRMSLAGLGGVLLSLNRSLDIGLLSRYYSIDYTMPYADALSSGSSLNNEQGTYIVSTSWPRKTLKISGSADIFRSFFPRYRLDAPASGHDFISDVQWTSPEGIQIQARFRTQSGLRNASLSDTILSHPEDHFHSLAGGSYRSLRLSCALPLPSAFVMRTRFESVQSSSNSVGYMLFEEIQYTPQSRSTGLSLRYSVYDVPYASGRIYANEQDIAMHYTVRSYSGSGSSWYLMLQQKISRHLSAYSRISRTGSTTMISGQIRWNW